MLIAWVSFNEKKGKLLSVDKLSLDTMDEAEFVALLL